MQIGKLNIIENQSLKQYHSFGIEVKSSYFIELLSVEQIEEYAHYISQIPKPIYYLGGGANSLFISDFSGTVVRLANKGIELVQEDENHVFVRVQAGENWDDFISFCIENEYYGLENLTAIPGQVGTAPIQNIGAYGVEAKDCIHEVYYVDLEDYENYFLENKDCDFNYRDSIFKHKLKDRLIITEVIFRLSKASDFHLEYGAIKQELKNQQIIQPTIIQVSNTIRKIRESKLPNPNEVGNAGSFFKNPVIDISSYEKLKSKFPEIVSYPNGDGKIKLAAAWMIDYLGWKGKEHHGAAVHTNQALVLINKNNASGKSVWELAQMIRDDVKKHFHIELESEVNIIE